MTLPDRPAPAAPERPTHTLAAEDLTLGYEGRVVVRELGLTVPPGRVTAIVGPNACGKSTLLRGLARLLAPESGRVLLDGEDVRTLGTRRVAQVLGLLPQSPVAPEGITVADLVGRGRYPHQGWLRRWTSADDLAVAEAMEATGVTDLAARPLSELSGGQRQRVWIAMALAQRTDLLLLDEPTTYLDIAHQVEVMDLLAELNADRGTTVVMVLHDLNQAVRYADHLVAMRAGEIVAAGAPGDVVTADLVERVFGLRSVVVDDPVTGDPMVVPVGRHRAPGHDSGPRP
ncbi:cobalamin/Fe3+-siderophore ABC transporter ATP-binding protein [Luteimicrobium album]|uniref:Cobalamin/Fe3+-siderophore ABC transporter ATP-binding protein n=1 Tax=Luteimicrobium album TaxID=1054550 RepID=A0ABQ6I5G5_9MICO|nr:ABC transporter ATP-binding protein [Luteimicrobium album]GMA25457.1 cobalamin/Fe3+-siderophore ABC transporter ATP-binding protein [Luteimicrobium album]